MARQTGSWHLLASRYFLGVIQDIAAAGAAAPSSLLPNITRNSTASPPDSRGWLRAPKLHLRVQNASHEMRRSSRQPGFLALNKDVRLFSKTSKRMYRLPKKGLTSSRPKKASWKIKLRLRASELPFPVGRPRDKMRIGMLESQ